MSQLKKQLLELLPELSRSAKSLKTKEAKRRWNYLRYIARSRSTVKTACIKLGVSEEWFRKWAHRLLKAKTIWVLAGQSRAPHRSPKKTKALWEKRILMARKGRPFEGCERIAYLIYEIYNKKISPGAVHKVLLRNGLVSKKKQKKLTKKHLKRYRQALPGYLQMDFKYVPYKITGRQFYQLSCVDHHSSWRFIRIYENKSTSAVESFLLDLERECPFPIIEIQTDNDLAFTLRFWKLRMGFEPTFKHVMAKWCEDNEVRHKLIPVGVKELNGKVENTHKQDDREFFSQINPQNLSHLQVLSAVYEERWNGRRKTKALGWKTPKEALWEAHIRVLVWFERLGLPGPISVLKIPKKKFKKMKRKSVNHRYLEWMEKDARKYGTDD
jgi:transposase InsO family protein